MIAAVSTGILPENTPPQTTTSRKKTSRGGGSEDRFEYFWFKFVDLSDEVATQVTKVKAWPVMVALQRSSREQERRGRTKQVRQLASAGTVGVGLNALCRSIGLSKGAARRQLAALEKLGMVVAYRPPPQLVTDPTTGRIKEKTGGRSPKLIVALTIQEHHCRPNPKDRNGPYSEGEECVTVADKVRSEPHDGVRSGPTPGRYKVRSGPPSIEKPNKTQRHRLPPSPRGSGGGSRWEQDSDKRPPEAWAGGLREAKEYTMQKLAAAEAAREAEAVARRIAAQEEREAKPMNPATVRAAEAATAADKPPHPRKGHTSSESPEVAAVPTVGTPHHPAQQQQPTGNPHRLTRQDRAALDVLNDTPREVVDLKQWEAAASRADMLRQQCAAFEGATDGVSMARVTIPIDDRQPAGQAGSGWLRGVVKALTG